MMNVVKDRLLKANHNEQLDLNLSDVVVKDRLLKANHNNGVIGYGQWSLSKIVY